MAQTQKRDEKPATRESKPAEVKPHGTLQTHTGEAANGHTNGHPNNQQAQTNGAPARREADGKTEWEKKISTPTVMGKKIKASMVENGPIKLYSIIGICTGVKTGESQYGTWTGFTGQFEATRLEDGKTFAAPVAFIPEPASSMMLGSLESSWRRNGGDYDVSIRFAFIIGIKPSDKAATGYEYTVEPVQSAEQNDALKELRALMHNKLPQLSAPAA